MGSDCTSLSLFFTFFLVISTDVTPHGVSTALARSFLIFRSTVRSQENPDIFLEKKRSVTASLQ